MSYSHRAGLKMVRKIATHSYIVIITLPYIRTKIMVSALKILPVCCQLALCIKSIRKYLSHRHDHRYFFKRVIDVSG